MNLLFPYDNNVEVMLPDEGPLLTTYPYLEYLNRTSSEKKFRKLVSILVQKNIIDKNKNVIDLGAWVGDNTIPWAKYFNGTIYAIDPSPLNCQFIEHLKNINDCKNVEVLNYAISDINEKVYFSGSEHHIQFNVSSGEQFFITETLDNLFIKNSITNIGFIHLDVEGFEDKVIRGANNIIEQYRPPIIWENHYDRDNYQGTIDFLKEKNYKTWMLNEITGCITTCRNFLSLQKDTNYDWNDIESLVNLGNLFEREF